MLQRLAILPLTEILLGLPLSGGWAPAPASLYSALNELLDDNSPMVEESVEDDGNENFNWLVRLTEQGIDARVRIEARWATTTNLS
ncbi:hypothetical protein [Acidisphaera sp. L21]|uniref:hypothetical protein n=1 Tax=Acidisphaera sp. L21 TaxID=1641851 RepID=UPI00131AEE40|nr:hypothetical protein [Acidisphaera sp. L21]